MSYTVYSSTNENGRWGQYEHGNFADPDAAEAAADDVHELMMRDYPDHRATWVEDAHGNVTHQLGAPWATPA